MKLKHVLLIDDNEVDNYINNRIISKCKIAMTVTVKKSAVEALEYLAEINDDFEKFPDLVFLDISMPLVDGFGFLDEFIKFKKVIENQSGVIMLSSSSDKSDIDRALQYEIVKDYFVKPLKMEMLQFFFEKKRHLNEFRNDQY